MTEVQYHETPEGALAYVFDSAVRADEWDVPPELGYLIETPEGWLVAQFSIDRERLDGNLIEKLSRMAYIASMPMAPDIHIAADCKMHGIVVMNEGWMLSFDPDDPDHDQKMADALAHKIDQRADRVEVRLISATTETHRYGAHQPRGGEASEVVSCTHEEASFEIGTNHRNGVALDGDLFESLHALSGAIRSKVKTDMPPAHGG